MDSLPEIILFDLDGTILDNLETVVDAYHNALIEYGYPPKEKSYIASLAGKSTHNTARGLDVRDEDLDKIDQYFWYYFRKFADDPEAKSVVFEGVLDTLTYAQKLGIKMGIVTSNEAGIANKMLKKVDLIKYFDVVIGAENVKNKKPHPEPVILALSQMGIDIEVMNKASVWFVGDTNSDVGVAKNTGILDFAIPQAHTFSSVILSEPSYLLDSMLDFYKFLTSIDN
jgi:HAD superfamily hydrolase (TIGR01549 family)